MPSVDITEGADIGSNPTLRPLADVGSLGGVTIKGPSKTESARKPSEGSEPIPNPVVRGKHYEKNQRGKLHRKAWQVRRANQIEGIVEVAKVSGCIKCGEKRLPALELHHRDPAAKDFELGKAILNGKSLERIKQEIEKCDLLCANCHRCLHAKERGCYA